MWPVKEERHGEAERKKKEEKEITEDRSYLLHTVMRKRFQEQRETKRLSEREQEREKERE